MTAILKTETDMVARLLKAIELLDSAGYTCWVLEEFAVENLFVFLDGIPTELPLLPGEVELLANAHDDLMSLAEWDCPDPSGPRQKRQM